MDTAPDSTPPRAPRLRLVSLPPTYDPGPARRIDQAGALLALMLVAVVLAWLAAPLWRPTPARPPVEPFEGLKHFAHAPTGPNTCDINERRPLLDAGIVTDGTGAALGTCVAGCR